MKRIFTTIWANWLLFHNIVSLRIQLFNFYFHMKKTISILLIISAFYSCNKATKENKIAVANWLIGKWENNSNQGNLIETWEKVNDSTFSGTAFFIKEKDTLHFEKMQVLDTVDNLFYIATVQGQNNEMAVSFQLTNSTPKQLIFENSKHDYPQKIIYNQISNDSMVVTISGIQQGKTSTESYPMKKK